MSATLHVLLSLVPDKNTPDVTTKTDGASGWLALIMVGLISGLVAILYFMNGSLRRASQTFAGTTGAKAVRMTSYEKARQRAEARMRDDDRLEAMAAAPSAVVRAPAAVAVAAEPVVAPAPVAPAPVVPAAAGTIVAPAVAAPLVADVAPVADAVPDAGAATDMVPDVTPVTVHQADEAIPVAETPAVDGPAAVAEAAPEPAVVVLPEPVGLVVLPELLLPELAHTEDAPAPSQVS